MEQCAPLSTVTYSQMEKNSTVSFHASWKITFGCTRTGHAHDSKNWDSICVWRRIYLCYRVHGLCFGLPLGTNELSWNFLAKFAALIQLRNPMLISTVFPGKCVKLSLYIDKPFPYFSLVSSLELSQYLMNAPYSTRVLTLIARDEENHLFRKRTSFSLQKNVLNIGIYNYHGYCSHDESKYPLMLNNPNPNSITIKKGFLGYTFVDCTQETTQTMSVIDNIAFINFVKAFNSELNNDMHVCSTEPYIFSSTENLLAR